MWRKKSARDQHTRTHLDGEVWSAPAKPWACKRWTHGFFSSLFPFKLRHFGNMNVILQHTLHVFVNFADLSTRFLCSHSKMHDTAVNSVVNSVPYPSQNVSRFGTQQDELLSLMCFYYQLRTCRHSNLFEISGFSTNRCTPVEHKIKIGFYLDLDPFWFANACTS